MNIVNLKIKDLNLIIEGIDKSIEVANKGV